jgi:hypothetical protein
MHRLAFIAAMDLHLGGWLTLAWIAAVSVLMLAGMIGRPLLRETPA